MTKILFICHGNICRSPMAEFVMKDLAAKAGRNGDFEIRTLLLRVYRRSEDYDIPEGGSEEFEIAEATEDVDAIEA